MNVPVLQKIYWVEPISPGALALILSFHPLYEADGNILCAGRDPGQVERDAIKAARAVILPQGCRESLYVMARENCSYVFPNYDKRFEYPNKIGQTRLFKTTSAPHPQTETFRSVAEFRVAYAGPQTAQLVHYPLVFKFDWGGEGDNVFLLNNARQMDIAINRAVSYEKTGQYGFLLQEFIPSRGQSLRVVVIHSALIAYWRMQPNPDAFYTNLKKGARIETADAPLLQDIAKKAVRVFCGKTHINLAGFDFLFSENSLQKGRIEPLFLEINYFFGRKGLGGSEAYYKILQREIDSWVQSVPQ